MIASRYKKDLHLEKVKSVADLELFPSVSFIIAAYNEEKVIEEKITNTIGLDYPKDKIEIIIVSDGSDDKTPDIVAKHSSTVIGLHDPKRGGKNWPFLNFCCFSCIGLYCRTLDIILLYIE